MKDTLEKKGTFKNRVESDRLVLGYQRDAFVRETWISATAPPQIDEDGLSFTVTIEPHGVWTTELHVVTALAAAGERYDRPKYLHRGTTSRPDVAQDLDAWLGDAPRLECDWEPLTQAYRRSLVDLAALRFTTLTMPGHTLPAAGLPWFMTISVATASSPAFRRCPSHLPSRRRRCGRSASARGVGPTTSETRTPAGSPTRCATES